jgi:putative phosphoesterase
VKIGVVADTHGFLDPALLKAWVGVKHILHAGDIGPPALLAHLEALAPVTAIRGNNDPELHLRETEVVQLGGHTLLLHHIVEPGRLAPEVERRAAQAGAGIVVFGHTHKPCAEHHEGRFYFNPGYAGRQRFRLERSAALLHLEPGRIRHEFIRL